MIKTYRRKNRECVLEINEHRIILADPQIQPWNEFVYNTPEDIFHFYYNAKIQFDSNYFYFQMTDEEKEEYKKEFGEHHERNWTFVASGYVTEFGVIQDLSKYIDQILKIDLDIEGQRHYYKRHADDKHKDDFDERDYVSRYDMEVSGIFQEDVYHITKYHEHIEDSKKKDKYYYSIYFGVSSDSRDNTVGFTAYQLTEEDMLAVKKWADDFMQLAKETTLRRIEGWYKEEDDSDPYCPYWLKLHIQEKYPEDNARWKEIWEKLYGKSCALEEYYKYAKGEETQNSTVIKESISKGKKDWEIFIDLYE